MRIYILGGSGMLGHAFIKHLSCKHLLCAPGTGQVPRIDVENLSALWYDIAMFEPDVIINLTAVCDMEKCEQYPDLALRTHAWGSANAALVADRVGATYVYLSSACVFDGNSERYSVSSLPLPISVYGKTKLMGEQIARSIPRHIVIRTEWCFGGGPEHDTKFIGKIYRQILSGKKEISAVGDKYGSLSYLPDLVRAFEKILEQGTFGTFHISCSGSATRYEIAKEFVRLLGADVSVQSVDSSFFAKEYSAPRPVWEVLDNSTVYGFCPRHWTTALAEYSKEFLGG